jgi:hypothetical protein
MAAGERARVRWLLTAGLVSACSGSSAPDHAGLLADVTAELGLPVSDGRWPDGTFFMPEIMQGGVGLFDADGDGVLELLHVRIPVPGSGEDAIDNRFYRRADPAARFADATRAANLVEEGYGQGLAVGDTDNDGDLDLYVTNYGPDVFYENDGAGRFTEVTRRAGLAEDGWSIAAAFCDYDADGFQDLYVVNYVRYDPGKRCTDPNERPEYCGPRSFRGAPDRLHRNQGDGTFRDVTRAAGIVLPQDGARATGLGIVFTDLTKDGRPDVYVANDAQANQLWVNQGDGRFTEEGITRGVALDRNGRPEASMGVALGDVNADGALDLLTTHMWEENNRLYLGTAGKLFRDASAEAGLSQLDRTGFGCAFLDLEHDGDLDLAIANGAVRKRPPLPGGPSGMWSEYAEPNHLFLNDGAGRFALAGADAGAFSARPEVGRGLALGDLDADGDLDVVVSYVDDSLRVFRNDAPPAGAHSVLVRTLTRGRDALGAQVTLRAGGREWSRAVVASASYGSSHDPRAHFGLGPVDAVDELVVLWVDGTRESFPGGPARGEYVLRQGEGRSP